MRKIFKISLLISLFGFSLGLAEQANAASVQSSGVSGVIDSIDQPVPSAVTGTPVLPLFLSEYHSESNSEIDPDISVKLKPGQSTDPNRNGHNYIRFQKQIDLSLTIRKLIFPFHTHL